MAGNEPNKATQKKGVRSFIGGTILTDERVTRQIPFVFFLAFLGLLLIANRFRSEKVIRQIEVVEDSIKELKSESVENAVRLMDVSRPSEVVERVEKAGLGLEEPQKPPRQLVVKKKKKGIWR